MAIKADALFSSASEEWSTPQDFFDKMNEEFHFTLDACATEENAKCEKFYTKADDGLSKTWGGLYGLTPHTAKTFRSGARKHTESRNIARL